MWVEPAQRCRGHGTDLLAAFEEYVRGAGCRQVLVSTYSFQALPFYLRHGYAITSRVPDVPHSGIEIIHLVKRWECPEYAEGQAELSHEVGHDVSARRS